MLNMLRRWREFDRDMDARRARHEAASAEARAHIARGCRRTSGPILGEPAAPSPSADWTPAQLLEIIEGLKAERAELRRKLEISELTQRVNLLVLFNWAALVAVLQNLYPSP